jgi:hypothetical protein
MSLAAGASSVEAISPVSTVEEYGEEGEEEGGEDAPPAPGALDLLAAGPPVRSYTGSLGAPAVVASPALR